MITPVIFDELFEFNDGLTPEFHDGVVYIDNVYKNYEDIHNMLNNSHVPRWKNSPSSKNFKDYYDCRVVLSDRYGNYHNRIESLGQLIRYFYNVESDIAFTNSPYEFNFFSNINIGVSNNLQHHPHSDGIFNVVVYLDKISSGGTAIYPEIKELYNNEQENLLFDISNYSKNIIKAKPNRMVIFKGKKYHGGYIENHDSYVGNNWRINQVMFFDELNDKSK